MTTHHDTPQVQDTAAYIDGLLRRAMEAGASDLHLEPVAAAAGAGGGGESGQGGPAVSVRFRIDGLLQTVEELPADFGRTAVLRLMVLGQLLTYRQDIPQESRVRTNFHGREFDLRLAIMPVAHGLRAVVRLPAELTQPRELEALGLPDGVLAALQQFAGGSADGPVRAGGAEAGGMLLVTGPAGSGKTTTIYALLSYLAKVSPGLSIISLEDPIERLIPGVTQIEVTPHGQMTYERALKSILRQDPQVLMLGEIRDAATATLAVQAALSGHRLIATMHAGDPSTAVARLLEMGIEPYQVTSSLFGVLTQRLVRRRDPSAEGRYKARVPVAEFVTLDAAARKAVLARADADTLKTIFAAQPGHETLRSSARRLVDTGLTDAAEIARVLGP